jgi:hypothetical protein
MTLSAKLWPGERIFPRPFFFLLFFSFILIYSLAPTVYSGDSGLFSAASYFLGSAHPPAYPLYILLGKLFTLIPFGNIAFRVNLLAAVFGAMTAIMAYEAALYVTKNYIISFFIVPVLLASPSLILASSQAKGIYTLNSFLVMLIFYLCLKALKEKNVPRYFLASSFVLGLGMGNHHIIGLMLFVILYAAIVRRKELSFRVLAFILILFAAGFSVYLYLYLRSIADAFINYSRVFSFADFFNTFFRAGYGKSTLQSIGEGASGYYSGWLFAIRNVGLILSKEIHPAIWLAVLFGLISTFKDRRIFWYLLISLAVWLPLARLVISSSHPTYNDLFITSTYFLPLIPLLAVTAAAGIYRLFEMIKGRLPLAAKAFVAGSIIFQLILVPVTVQKSSLSDYYLPYTWIKDVSKVFRPKSFFFAFGDNPAFLPFYMFGVERLRDDVLCLDAVPGLNSFRLTIAPAWKFSSWYPEFYKKSASAAEYFYPIAREGRLYASSIGSIPENIREKFDTGLYVLMVILKPKNFARPINDRFKEDFAKIDYTSIMLSYKPDFMAEEILQRYVKTILTYANLLADENSKDADLYYRLALFSSGSGLQIAIMKDYTRFVAEKRGVQEALRLLEEFKKSGMPDKNIDKIEGIEKDLRNSAAS